MNPVARMLLVDYHFNGVYNKFPKFRAALEAEDYKTALAEYKRYWTNSKGEVQELTRRNDWVKGILEQLAR